MLFSELKTLQPAEPEPMLNMLASFEGSRWTVHIFPRKLHRPWQYFETGEKQILLSPASVDMGGILITPRKEDFEKLTMHVARDIFEQVCLGEPAFAGIVNDLF